MNELSGYTRLKLAAGLLFKTGSTTATLLGYARNVKDAVPTDQLLLKAYSRMPWLRAAFGKVADGVAAAPWYMESVSQIVGSKKVFIDVPTLKFGSNEARSKMRKIASKSMLIEQTVSHPMLDLLANPNPFITGHGLMKLTQLHIDLTGEALWWVEDENGKPKRLWPIPPNWISERPSKKNGNSKFKLIADGMPKELDISEVVWFRDPDPADPYESTVGVAGPISDELAADEYAAKHVKAYFQNSARPDLLISGTGLGPEEAERAEEKWLQKLRGYLKVGRPHFIGKEVKVQELGQSFVNMQLIDLRKFQRDVVIQSLGLPPEIMGIIESSNRATINGASYVFAKWVLITRLDVIRETIQIQLVPRWDGKYILAYSSPVEEDREFRLTVMKASPYSWSIDDWREVVGDDPMPNGQGRVIVIPNASSLANVDEILEWESPYTQ
ncbi:MAG: hypothetical protein DRR06_18565, partial [Gammaproteobacteria bacterium]